MLFGANIPHGAHHASVSTVTVAWQLHMWTSKEKKVRHLADLSLLLLSAFSA
jgi:hypothetical protein